MTIHKANSFLGAETVLGLLLNSKMTCDVRFGMYISFQHEVLADLLYLCVSVYFSLFKLAVFQIYGENVFPLSAAADISVGSCSQLYSLS